MPHRNRLPVTTAPRWCGSVDVSTVAPPSMTEGPTRPRCPEGMAVVATAGSAVGTIGDAVILEGRLPDSYQHQSPVNSFLSFGLRGRARFDWKRVGACRG